MPRRSAASLAVPRVNSASTSLAPPAELSSGAKQLWRSLIASTPTDHFRASDVPLLASYCTVSTMADEAATEIASGGAVVNGKPSPWLAVYERLLRSQATLALRLRLCPSARQDPKTTGRQKVPSVPNVDFTRVK